MPLQDAMRGIQRGMRQVFPHPLMSRACRCSEPARERPRQSGYPQFLLARL